MKEFHDFKTLGGLLNSLIVTKICKRIALKILLSTTVIDYAELFLCCIELVCFIASIGVSRRLLSRMAFGKALALM